MFGNPYDNLVTIGADALSLTNIEELNKVIDSLYAKMRASESFDYKMAIEEVLELLEPYRDSLQEQLTFEEDDGYDEDMIHQGIMQVLREDFDEYEDIEDK